MKYNIVGISVFIVFFVGIFSGILLQENVVLAADSDISSDVQTAPKPSFGSIIIDISDVLGRDLPSKIVLIDNVTSQKKIIEIPSGQLETQAPLGSYEAYIYVYDQGVPILVEIKKIKVVSEESAFIAINILEGASGHRSIRDFDTDLDLAIDRVEQALGTDPADPASVPGYEPLPQDKKILSPTPGWYRGELHAHSKYGRGRESVAELVQRAEKLKLDFLAITDLNTMAACKDPAFRSDQVILIPAMEWGSDEKGVALIYGARTFPDMTDQLPEAQAIIQRVQEQGGIVAAAHPCFPTSPWRWNLAYLNATEVWCREWRSVPPLREEDLTATAPAEPAPSSIVQAARTVGFSANGQATRFWECELDEGYKMGAIGGSNTADPKVPMAEPVTYVFAREKSVAGILEGLRYGRTYISSGLNGPQLYFAADVRQDGLIDVSYGGIIPLGVETRFRVQAVKAAGKQVEILMNGYPILNKTIEGDNFTLLFAQQPISYAVYRARVIDSPSKPGFGAIDVLALSSPIYAQDLLMLNRDQSPKDMWLKIEAHQGPDVFAPLPPEDPSTGAIQPNWEY